MDRLITVDPGKNVIGWASFKDRKLSRCGLIQGDLIREAFKIFDGLKCFAVIEVPQVYRSRHLRGDPNDLIDVALIAGAIQGFLRDSTVELVRPHRWKGNVPKTIHNKRVLDQLRPYELNHLNKIDGPASLRHNVIDAIGIGLWRLGRKA